MALTAGQLTAAWHDLLQITEGRGLPTRFVKADLQAAAAAADAWADSVAAAYNSALPVGFRTNATAPEKSLLLAYVCLKRAGL